MEELNVESLETLCLDQVVNLIPLLGNELEGLPLALFKSLLPRCDDYRCALIHNIAIKKGLDIQTLWRDRCRARFLWFYRHKFKSNLHDPFWQCHKCLATTLNDPQDVDWYQTYMDKICEENLEKIRTTSLEQGREVPRTCVDEETKAILKYPFWRDSEDTIHYKPHQLFLNIKTVIALTRSSSALRLMADHLHTLMCRVRIPTQYRELATSALERFVKALLDGGNLETMYLKEQQIMRGEAVDYACLLAMLLLGRVGDQRETDMHTEQSLLGQTVPKDISLETQGSTIQGSPQTTDKDGDFSEDLYDFCFKEPVKVDFYSAMEDVASDADTDARVAAARNVHDMFCEEGAVGEENMDCLVSSYGVPGDTWKDECCHYVDTDSTYFHHISIVPDLRPNLGHSISNLVLVYVRLNPGSCTALSNCLVGSTSLHSLALIQCVMPACGWCEVMSGLALRAHKGLVLQELALTCSQTHRNQPKSMFGQYCVHKLNQMLETYHIRNHKMKSLKLELLLSHKCQAAENSYLPKYLPSIHSLTLNCWRHLTPWDHSNPHPLHQLVSLSDLAAALPSRHSLLTDLVLENSSLETMEVDTLLAAAANSPVLKRVSIRNNKYSTSQPKGLLALLQHTGLCSLNICQCKFSLKVCESDYQESLVDALIKNCSLQHLNLSDRILDDADLAILSRAFTDTRRTKQNHGYCLNICLSPFSSGALMQFGQMLAKDVDGCHGNKRRHSLDHLSLDWRCVNMIRTLKTIIPQVTCPHRLS